MHAADVAEAVHIPPEPVIRQFHVTVRTDGHVDDLPIPGDIHRDFPVQGAGALRQQLHQFPRQKGVLLQLIAVQAVQPREHRVPDALDVSLHIVFHDIYAFSPGIDSAAAPMPSSASSGEFFGRKQVSPAFIFMEDPDQRRDIVPSVTVSIPNS